MRVATLRKHLGDKCHYCQTIMTFPVKRKNNPTSATIEHLICAYESPTLKRIGGYGNCVLAWRKCNNERDHKFHRENKETVIRGSYLLLKMNYQKRQFDETLSQTRKDRMLRQIKDMEIKYPHLTSSETVIN